MLENKVELFDDELEVIQRIKELKLQGYKEEDMYIIVDDDEEISMLKGATNVMIKEEDDSLFDRFKNFLKGNDSVTDAFNRMDLDEKYRDSCYEEVQDGKILLMVNKDYESKFELTEDGLMIPREEDLTDEEDEVFKYDKETDITNDDLGFEARKEKNVIGDFIITDVENEEFKDR